MSAALRVSSRTETPEESLLRRVEFDTNGGCWLWTGTFGRRCYGVFYHTASGMGRTTAHRASYRVFVGPIPSGMLICHKCDIPSCINPAHLYAGTPLDNARDFSERGKRTVKRKLTADQVREIRAARPHESERGLARRYGVNPFTIKHIVSRKHFADVD